MINIEDKRGSGRITRMLFDTVQTALIENGPVYVVAANANQATELRHRLHTMFAHDSVRRVYVTHVGASDVQRRKGEFLVDGAHPEHTFVDHYVYYVELQRLAALFEGFHKYD